MAEDGKVAQQKQRSPEHPAISLQDAVTRAQEFYKHESFNYAPVDVAKKHWGYGALSSSGMRLLAALLHYGLLEETGNGKERRVRLTALSKSILLDRREDTTERDAALRKAALNPAIYAALWKLWGPSLPSDANMEFELIQKFKFNPVSVRAFIKDFKATIEYAKLAQSSNFEDASDTLEESNNGRRSEERTPPPPPPPFTTPQVAHMPAVQPDGSAVTPLDIPVPLANGRRAILRVPGIISQREYDLILKTVADNLENFHDMLVSDPVQQPAPHEGA